LELLKKCPNCGKHFTVKKEGKELVGTDHHMEQISPDRTTRMSSLMSDSGVQNPMPNPNTERIPVETETFETTYECTHCHYKWTEKSVEVVEGNEDPKEFRA
jgi:transposase-like protein